ncbi:MAG: hypothetical protein ABSB69_03120 [Solirubrobacteraceae bacterium]
MPDRLRPALGLAMAAAAVLLSGCGSAGKPAATAHTTAQGPPTTKARFVAQAGAICHTLSAQEKLLKARQEALKGLPAQSADTAFVALVDQLVADSRAAESKLRALGRPAGDARAIEGLLSALSEEATDASGIAKAADNQENSLGEAAEQALKRSVAANSALAAAYGMSDCIGSE